MLQVTHIRQYYTETIAGLKKKFVKDSETFVQSILTIDDQRKEILQNLESFLAQANASAKEIGALMKSGKKDEAEILKAQTKKINEESAVLKEKLKTIEAELLDLLYKLPNVPHADVPEGRTAEDNKVVFESKIEIALAENAAPHWELIKKYDIIDFDLGNKITGAGFPIYKGKGARLQRALINFFLDEAISAGYYEVQPPIFVNQESGIATGQLPDKDGQMYHMTEDNLYAIPTAEVPITNMYRDTILKPSDLPVKLAGHTPCFRREAGSWGADVRGLNRLHQFDKVEIVQILHPDNSYQALLEMRKHVEMLLEKLELPYRVLLLCGGDMGFTSAMTYDLEVYSGAQKRWLEVSSVSNFETYQSNRLKLRLKEENKTTLLHTLNGSALALPRIVASILENNQTEEGIKIPKVLVPYTGFDIIN